MNSMLYPVALAIHGWPVIVVGAGTVATRRVHGLLECGAHVTVVAPSASTDLAELARAGRIRLHLRAFVPADLEDMRLAIAATDSAAVNAAVLTTARERAIPCNDAITADNGDFRVPAVHRAGAITIAIDTAGSSPAFARRIRNEIAAIVGEDHARAASVLRTIREITTASVPPEGRAAVMNHFTDLPIRTLADMQVNDCENAVEEFSHSDRIARAGAVSFITESKICASRRSKLALTQTRSVMAALAAGRIVSTVLEISSTGDAKNDVSLSTLGSGIFVNELETALREGRADYAVHSCKDLPSVMSDDLCIAAIPEREDPRDVFCSARYATLAELPAGATIGTSSPRRRTQLERLRPDIRCVEIRGNVDTRLRRMEEGEYDAIVLAAAGLRRLNIAAQYTVPFTIEEIIPAPAQGALAVQTRAGEHHWNARLAEILTHPPSELCVVAERAFLAEIHGGCQAPIGAFAHIVRDDAGKTLLELHAIIASSGSAVRSLERVELPGMPNLANRESLNEIARAAGRRSAQRLLADGGLALLRVERPLYGRHIVLGRTQNRPGRIGDALRSIGARVVEVYADAAAPPIGAVDAILFPSSGSVGAISRHYPVERLHGAPVFIAAMGPQSAAAATGAGFTPNFVADDANVAAFVHGITQALLEHDT